MDPSFLDTATAGLSSATVVLLTYMALTQRHIDKRLERVESIMSKVLGRVQHLSVKQGLAELDLD